MNRPISKDPSLTSRVAHWARTVIWLLTPPTTFLVWTFQPPHATAYLTALAVLVGLACVLASRQRDQKTREGQELLRTIGVNQRLILESQRRLSERMVYLEFRASKKSG